MFKLNEALPPPPRGGRGKMAKLVSKVTLLKTLKHLRSGCECHILPQCHHPSVKRGTT